MRCLARRFLFCVFLAAALFWLRSTPRAAAQLPDVVPPTITAAATPAPNANGWNRTNVTVRFTCADTASQIAVCPKAVVVTADGANQVISGVARDKAGNTATASMTVNLDKTAPVVTATRSPEPGQGGWVTTPITAVFAATDALSGVVPDSITLPVVIKDRRDGYAKGTARDLADNVGAFTLTGLNSDTRLPTIGVTLSPDAVAGYRTGPVTAHYTCFDALSGVALCPPDQVFTNPGGGQVATGTMFDSAGNPATASRAFNIASPPPPPPLEAPDRMPTIPADFELVDLIADNGFETSVGGFEPNNSPADGSAVQTAVNPIDGQHSLSVTSQNFGRMVAYRDYPFNGGPLADSLTVKARIRVESASAPGRELQICAIAYLQNTNVPLSTCESLPVDSQTVVNEFLNLDTGGQQIDAVIFQFKLDNTGSITATVDDAHLYLVQRTATPAPVPTPTPDPTPDPIPGPTPDPTPTPDPAPAPPPPTGDEMPVVPADFELVDLIADNGFETSVGGFEPNNSPADGSVLQTAVNPIQGLQSLRVTSQNFGRMVFYKDYPFNGGPLADSLTVKAKVRVESASAPGHQLQVCAIAYLQSTNVPLSNCRNFPVDSQAVVNAFLNLSTGGQQIDNVIFQFKLENTGSITAVVDDAHLYLVQKIAPPTPTPEPGPGPNPNPTPTPDSDLEVSGFSLHPTNYRSMLAEMDIRGDLSSNGAAFNTAVKDVTVKLVPAVEAVGQTRRVSFGFPLPPGVLLNTADLRVTSAAGEELPAFVRSLGAWEHMPPQDMLCNGLTASGNPGIRSVLVQFDLFFESTTPINVTVGVNRARAASLESEVPVLQTYRIVNDGTYSPEVNFTGLTIREPMVLAAIDTRYLSCTGISPMVNVAGTQSYLAAIDQATDDFFYSTINDFAKKQTWPVSASFNNNYLDSSDPEPWLYQRGQTFYNGYFRSGNVDMLREANRAVDHYAQNVYRPENCPTSFYPYCVGSFALKNPNADAPYPDLKYSYSEELATNYWLTGNETYLKKIGHISWGMEMHVGLTASGPDTERHRGFALLAHAVDCDLTGSAHQCAKVASGIEAMRSRQASMANGCFNYSPEGTGDTFSPWMSTMLAYGFLRSYQATGDAVVPLVLTDLARCEVERGITALQPGESGPMPDGYYYPYYIAASTGTPHDVDGFDPWSGFEHALDVAVPIAMGAYFTTDVDQRALFQDRARKLLLTHDLNIAYWTRDAAATQQAQASKYRNNPDRKYLWQYIHADLLGWLLGGRNLW